MTDEHKKELDAIRNQEIAARKIFNHQIVTTPDKQEDEHMFNDPLKPSIQILIALGSIAVHVDEGTDPKEAHKFDITAVRSALEVPGLRAWIKKMGPLLPLKRNIKAGGKL